MSGKKSKPKSVLTLAAQRSPGLDGTFTDTCIGCRRPTDTALGVLGDPEWHAAFLVSIGLPSKEAIKIVESGETPDGIFSRVYRVCGKCAARVPSLPKPALALGGDPVPTIGQPIPPPPARR